MDLKDEADRRHRLHEGQATHRPLSQDYELVGLAGEKLFAIVFGLDVDWDLRIAGDNGKDFGSHFTADDGRVIWCIIDVKCARKPGNLIVEQGKVNPQTIYVLAQYFDDTGEVHLLGWEWGKNLLNAPTKDFGYGIINHYIKQRGLRSIVELLMRHKSQP